MAGFTFATSFASAKQYVRAQARVTVAAGEADTAILHLQGRGPVGNRDYGFATNVAVSAKLGNWLAQQERK